MTEPVDVLAIAAHPDDAEVGCAGVLLLGTDAGLRVGVADLSDGELATRGSPRLRGAERYRASTALGLTTRVGLGLPDGGLGADPAHRGSLIRLIRELRPTVVLTPYSEDRHPDHAAAGRLTREASFLAGVEKVEAGTAAAHRPARVYHYMVHHPFEPSFVVDITPVWDRKLEVLAAYESQFGGSTDQRRTELLGGGFLRVVEARSTFYGSMIGVERGEPYSYPGPVPLTFLPGILDLGPAPPAGYSVFH